MTETMTAIETEAEDTFEAIADCRYSIDDDKIRIYPSGERLDKHLGEEYAAYKPAKPLPLDWEKLEAASASEPEAA